MSAATQSLDDALRAMLSRSDWNFDSSPPELLVLGQPALDRLLDAPDGVFFPTDTEWRDYGANRRHAIAAFAKHDMEGVLAAMRKRKWTDAAIALSGAALVRDARLVPLLVATYGEREPLLRRSAVELLGNQRDPLATATVIRALRDRSSDVRLAAIRALGEIGDPEALDHLEQLASRKRGSSLIAAEASTALRKIRKARRAH